MTDHDGATPHSEFVAPNSERGPDVPEIAESSPLETEQVSARERTQHRLAAARATARDTTIRARNYATFPSRRTMEPDGESVDAPTITLADRAEAYRAHLISAAVAVIALLVVVLKRRATAHDDDGTVDLGQWHLHAEPIEE